MSISSTNLSEEIIATYLTAAPDPMLADYSPAWVSNLSADVTLEGSMVNGTEAFASSALE